MLTSWTLADREAVMKAARHIRLSSATMILSGFASAALFVTGAEAQTMELGSRQLAMTRQELNALSELGKQARGGQKGFQDRALAEARRVANGRDARHVLALYELEIAERRRDHAMRAQALDVLIASEITESGKLPGYLQVRGQIGFLAGDLDTAEKTWSRLHELTPLDPEVLTSLGQVRLARNDAPGAMDLITRAIAAREEMRQTVPEGWQRQKLSTAQQGRLVEPGIAAARALVMSYPTAANWRDALVVYRQLTSPTGAFEIDFLRLMRHVGVLVRAAEFQRMAQLLNLSGAPGEAKAVLDEGVTRGLLDAGTSPTREIIAEVDRKLGGRKQEAADGFEASNKAGAQVRLGMAKLRAGERAEAEVAFRSAAVDSAAGPYADLASFWLASILNDRGSVPPTPAAPLLQQ